MNEDHRHYLSDTQYIPNMSIKFEGNQQKVVTYIKRNAFFGTQWSSYVKFVNAADLTADGDCWILQLSDGMCGGGYRGEDGVGVPGPVGISRQ